MATGYNNKDRYPTVGKMRRSSPGDSHAHGAFFQTGQGGRPILPPLANSFPTSRSTVPPPNYSTYTQPRSTPKLDYNINPQVYGYGQPTGASPQFPPTFPNNYEMYPHERHSPQPSYPAYPSRSMTPGMGAGGDRARLPPLTISPNPQGDRWQQQQAYLPQHSGYHGNAIRSPIATYPPTYSNYSIATQANPYGYHIQPGPHDHLAAMNPHGHHGLYDELRLEPRSNSPYVRSSGSSHVSSHGSTHVPPPRAYTPPPVTPTSPEEPTIKKKRKRADAAQLKVLNETYNRTAFPSTEERIALAKMLDMSARSVQIWFQNKRQSMRQTNRQSTSASSSHHHYGMASQVDPMAEDLVPHPQPGYDTGSGGMGDPLYLTGPSQDASRSHGSHSHSHYHSSHRHGRESEVVDPRKWSRP